MVENNVTELFGVSFNYKQVTKLAHCNCMATEFGQVVLGTLYTLRGKRSCQPNLFLNYGPISTFKFLYNSSKTAGLQYSV